MGTNKDITNLADIQLYTVWLTFLNHAGKYAKRYYMARDLELPLQEQNPRSRKTMLATYGTEEALHGAIQHDLDTFPSELRAINAAQITCGLRPFSDRDDYLAQIAMGFTMLDRHGKERREYYRRKVNKALKTLREGGEVEAQSLNAIEADFFESQRRAAKRREKKAAEAAKNC